ncbi:class I SAM-dependent methyltransferase [Mobilitalea sibirica]|uniref:Class I SAM-dependent methyltransferase n=1 Tax=Mobilitalea sibirica TaxID=1462919 RepID=A0A8J7H184_9FIRM|nr:class I SAM-dependent methyltransferase [Mobilitalea sibirica]MBH1942444.1 class I SAM-dependent methyltransferase [Mobilitalea sibirica]
MDSIEYYNKNAGDFYEGTVNLDMQESWDRFCGLLPEGGSILDLGCGSGRDSAYFISQGFDVTAMDASEEMCSLASIHIGQDVLQLTFSEMDFEEVFDGVWACASLLHVPSSDMEDILGKVTKSLKPNGIIYMSFRYGDFEGILENRYFTYYRSKAIKELISKFDQLELIEIKKSEDVREDRDILWISALIRKID